MTMLGYVTNTANICGDAFESVLNTLGKGLKHGGSTITSTGLGAISGRFMSMGGAIGAFQGTVQGTLYGFFLRPIGTYISDHAGNKQDQFNDNARYLLYTVGTVVNYAVPIFITLYWGKEAMTALSGVLPESVRWIVLPVESAEYAVISGLLLNCMPSIIQLGISSFKYVEPKKQHLS